MASRFPPRRCLAIASIRSLPTARLDRTPPAGSRRKTKLTMTTRPAEVWFCFIPPRWAGEHGTERFFRHWRGEALYNSHVRDPATSPALRAVGPPALVAADVPIALLGSPLRTAFAVRKEVRGQPQLRDPGARRARGLHHSCAACYTRSPGDFLPRARFSGADGLRRLGRSARVMKVVVCAARSLARPSASAGPGLVARPGRTHPRRSLRP